MCSWVRRTWLKLFNPPCTLCKSHSADKVLLCGHAYHTMCFAPYARCPICNNIPMEDCAICLEMAYTHSAVRTRCHHVFHFSCLLMWQRKGLTCPICRAKVPRLSKLFPKLVVLGELRHRHDLRAEV